MTQEKNLVNVRFSPSPTGFLHIGGLRTALFNYLFARKNEGEFLLRIEDTDQTRYVEGAVDQIINTLKAYGIAPDNLENLIYQSARLTTYKKFTDELVEQGNAYECFCPPDRLEALRQEQTEARQAPKYDRLCLNRSGVDIKKLRESNVPHVIRLKIPEGKTTFRDLIFGEISVDNRELDDQVLLKSDGFPTYHLANVVDDHEMEISHVIRGEEWIPSTPKHVILYQMFDWDIPKFAHLPLIVKADRKKLSKRDQAADAQIYLKYFETESVLNYIAFLGWNPKTEQEIFTKDELIQNFALEKVNRAPAVFDDKKLNWMNKQWILKKGLENSRFYENIKRLLAESGEGETPPEFALAVANLVLQRVENSFDLDNLFRLEFYFFFTEPEYKPNLLLWKKNRSSVKTAENLKKIREFIDSIGEADFKNSRNLEEKTKQWIAQNNYKTGDMLWPLRVALCGLEASPGPFEIMAALASKPEGKNIIVRRIEKAIEKLQKKN